MYYKEDLSGLEEKIGHRFENADLLAQALNHSSFVNEHKKHHLTDNERLEFLGDAVLELCSSEYLYKNYPDMPEGNMTRLRASLVCEPTLAMCARELDLPDFIRLGRGEELTGGRKRDSIVSDATEAVIGAVFLAVYTLLGSRLRKSFSTISYTFLAYAGASVVLLCACLVTSVPLTGWSTDDYFYSFLMTVFCTYLGHSIFNWGLRYLPAPFISTCRLGEPVLATILAVVVFGEVPGPHQIIGGVIVLAGLYIYCMRD